MITLSRRPFTPSPPREIAGKQRRDDAIRVLVHRTIAHGTAELALNLLKEAGTERDVRTYSSIAAHWSNQELQVLLRNFEEHITSGIDLPGVPDMLLAISADIRSLPLRHSLAQRSFFNSLVQHNAAAVDTLIRFVADAWGIQTGQRYVNVYMDHPCYHRRENAGWESHHPGNPEAVQLCQQIWHPRR